LVKRFVLPKWSVCTHEVVGVVPVVEVAALNATLSIAQFALALPVYVSVTVVVAVVVA
jgi:hypothetical protein